MIKVDYGLHHVEYYKSLEDAEKAILDNFNSGCGNSDWFLPRKITKINVENITLQEYSCELILKLVEI